ncbi:MAG: response regulator [Thermoanaerobaculia bacterium]
MKRKRILVVDDSSTVLMMEKMILAKAQYEIITASNGEEAWQKAASDRPDAILMDVVMPKMNGFEAVRRIREVEHLALTPIIMVTTRSEMENVEEGFSSGCNDYVTKPVNGTELVAKLRSLVGE